MAIPQVETKTAVKEVIAPETQFRDKIRFPHGFLLGAASAAHQVEGDNINSDWWAAEIAGLVPKSGLACDHYHLYDKDFEIAHDIGMNAMRISIEWARIEPVEGRWDNQAIEHYRKVLKSMKAHGLTRMVTLWHWTLPKWLADQGGFETRKGVEAFARYSWFIAQNLGKDIDLWITLNEPEVYAGLSYQQGRHPPFKKDLVKTWQVLQNLIAAHKASYRAIKGVLDAKIGIAKNSAYYEPYRKNNAADRILSFFADRISNHYFLEKVQRQLDFIGVNYYFYNRVKFDFSKFYREMNVNFPVGQMKLEDQENRSDLGWVLHPEGIYHLLLDLKKKYKLPVYVTENGLADAIDSRRPKFLRETLQWISKAVGEGVKVQGYFHWSLTDNYEWAQGYGPRFGLIEIDYSNQKRTVRKSAEVLKEVEIGNK